MVAREVPRNPRETAAARDPAPADAQARYLNRELSSIEFDSRVLALAERASLALLERVRFLAIFSSNLDEFFQVRVAALKDQLAAGISGTSPDGLSVSEQLRAVRATVAGLLDRRRDASERVLEELAGHGVSLTGWDSLDAGDRAWAEAMFAERVFPVLTPLAVDPGHPFPYISNLSLNLAVIVRDPAGGERKFARVKVPPLLPGLVAMPDGKRFVLLEQVIAAHLESLFPGMEIESQHPFRVTRNVDLTLEEEEADDLLEAVEMELRRRRFGRAVRLEVDAGTTAEVRALLMRELDLHPDDVYDVEGPLDLTALWVMYGLDRPDLKEEPLAAVTPARLAGTDREPVDVFAAINQGDILVHHPYESFSDSVEAFVMQAARDPFVLAIKQTLYRTSGDSAIVRALIRAAESGKQVAALVELKARGDEVANIGWAKALEQAGVHVVYGLVGLKTHSKISLVVRQEGKGIRRYCHIGTGNYNSTTARLYEDLGVLSASPELGADLSDLFNYLTGYSRRTDYGTILVAPSGLRTRMLELIEREARLGTRGRIVWKLNNLTDTAVIDALYAASAAGVRVDLIVRSICCLRPQVPGLSENISVRSIVGRWLEHSRVYWFGNGSNGGRGAGMPEGGDYYFGSADMMERNLDRRVEVVVPVRAPELQARLREILDVELEDLVDSWVLGSDGRWSPSDGGEAGVASGSGTGSAQQRLQESAASRARRRREPDGRAAG